MNRGIPEPITLHQLLCLLPSDTRVGIWDCRKPYSENRKLYGYEKYPNRQSYCKVKNLNYEKVKWLLTEEVRSVAVTDGGVFIQIMEARDKFYEHFNRSQLAHEIAKEMKG